MTFAANFTQIIVTFALVKLSFHKTVPIESWAFSSKTALLDEFFFLVGCEKVFFLQLYSIFSIFYCPTTHLLLLVYDMNPQLSDRTHQQNDFELIEWLMRIFQHLEYRKFIKIWNRMV